LPSKFDFYLVNSIFGGKIALFWGGAIDAKYAYISHATYAIETCSVRIDDVDEEGF
jgi:hypothetical protein